VPEIVSLHEGKDTLYDECMGYLRSKMLFADDICPIFLASIGCHIANEYQLKSGTSIYSYKGLPEDLCLHVAIIAPAGFSKGHTFKLFLHPKFGIIPFPAKISGKVTEAGYVGTIKENGLVPGMAERYSHGIIAFNEISNLFITSQSQHSGELLNQVLESLSERHVNKKLASGEIDFDTYLTLWGGTNPGRFDFSGGMERRFAFVARAWSEEDLELLKKDRKEKRGEKVDYSKSNELRRSFELLKRQFEVEKVSFEAGMMEYVFESSDSHLRMQIMERALIGKNVLEWHGERELKIPFSEGNKRFIDNIREMYEKVAFGTDISLLMNVIGQGGKSRGELWNMFRRFGYTFEKFETLLETCLKLSLIGVKVNTSKEGIEKTFFKRSMKG